MKPVKWLNVLCYIFIENSLSMQVCYDGGIYFIIKYIYSGYA